MLKVYICPKCKSVRFVSKYKTECFKCNQEMYLSSIPYEEYILLDPEERNLVISQTVSI